MLAINALDLYLASDWYCKGTLSRLILTSIRVTYGFSEELSTHAGRDGSEECPNCGPCKVSVEHALLNVHIIFKSKPFQLHVFKRSALSGRI